MKVKHSTASYVRFLFFVMGIGLLVKGGIFFVGSRSIKELCIECEGACSVQAQDNVKTYLNKQVPVSLLSSEQLCATIQDQNKWVRSIDIFFIPGGKARIVLVAHTPLYVINNRYVITQEGVLVPIEHFEQTVTNTLYSIKVAGDEKQFINSEMGKRFIAQLKLSFLDRYTCVWESDTCVRWYDKQDSFFSIISHPNMLPDKRMLSYCDIIKQELAVQETGEKKRQLGITKWLADIRFKDQIVVSQEKGGSYGAPI